VLAVDVPLTALVNETSYLLEGYTAPNSIVFISEGAIVGTTTSDATGFFSKLISPVIPGLHTVDIWSTDIDNVSTAVIQFNIFLIDKQEFDITHIYLPTTVSLNASPFIYSDTVSLFGYTKPGTNIKATLVGAATTFYFTTSGINGYYVFNIPAITLPTGDYSISTELILSGIIDNPTISNTITFHVDNNPPIITPFIPTQTPIPTPALICPYFYQRMCFFDEERLGYLNKKSQFLKFLDGFLKYWGQPVDNIYDINENGWVDEMDLSIVLFYWRGEQNEIVGYYSNLATASGDLLELPPLGLGYLINAFIVSSKCLCPSILLCELLLLLLCILLAYKKKRKDKNNEKKTK